MGNQATKLDKSRRKRREKDKQKHSHSVEQRDKDNDEFIGNGDNVTDNKINVRDRDLDNYGLKAQKEHVQSGRIGEHVAEKALVKGGRFSGYVVDFNGEHLGDVTVWKSDTLSNDPFDTYFSSLGDNERTIVGSAASGTLVPGESDVDYMIVPNDVTINESALTYDQFDPCYLKIPNNSLCGVSLVLSGDHGFARASMLRDFHRDIFGSFQWPSQEKGESRVGKILRGAVTIDNIHMNGPFDYVPQLKLSGLPTTARTFADRDRNWPDRNVIASIISGEFHITARISPSNPDQEHDFCLSFAKAEVSIAKAMRVEQKRCIVKLKRLKKSLDCDGLLTSYHMKTVAYWFFEDVAANIWDIDDIEPIVIKILAKLAQFVCSGHLPHYFVPTQNLLCGATMGELNTIKTKLHNMIIRKAYA